MITALTAALGAALNLLLPAIAQAQVDRTGTGGGPLSTERAPNTSALGRTKPPSRAASPASPEVIEKRTPQQQEDQAITKGICVGCGTK